MIDISSHLKRSEFKMRVLIVSALLAYAAAAPSGLITPYIYQPLVLSAAVPTVSAGDIQAAAINAQVQINDLARAAADQAIAAADLARAAADEAHHTPGDDQAAAIDAQVKINDAQIQANDAQILANDAQAKSNDAPVQSNDDVQADDSKVQADDAQVQANDQARAAADNAQGAADQAQIANEKALLAVDQINEKNFEAFWSNEERKWEAIDAVNTAQARIDGSAAGNADLNAKVAIGGVVPYYSPIAPVARVAPVWGYNGVPAVGPVVGQPIVRYAPFPAVNGPFATTYVQNVW